jgi:hypothetical protein
MEAHDVLILTHTLPHIARALDGKTTCAAHSLIITHSLPQSPGVLPRAAVVEAWKRMRCPHSHTHTPSSCEGVGRKITACSLFINYHSSLPDSPGVLPCAAVVEPVRW